MHHYPSHCTFPMRMTMMMMMATRASLINDSLLSHNRFLSSHGTCFSMSHFTHWENHQTVQYDEELLVFRLNIHSSLVTFTPDQGSDPILGRLGVK